MSASRTRRFCSSSSSICFICSSSSPTLAALLSRNALCAALFWAFLLVGGVSVAGLRPGFGRGGMTHFLLVSDDELGGVSVVGEVAQVGVGEGLSDVDGRSDGAGVAGARRGGDAAAIMVPH